MCFNKLYVNCSPNISKAISCEQEGERKEAYDFYKLALSMDPLHEEEKHFCEHQAIK